MSCSHAQMVSSLCESQSANDINFADKMFTGPARKFSHVHSRLSRVGSSGIISASSEQSDQRLTELTASVESLISWKGGALTTADIFHPLRPKSVACRSRERLQTAWSHESKEKHYQDKRFHARPLAAGDFIWQKSARYLNLD